ncbi:polysaccharide biosynthesis protein [Flavobacterium johnsoniae]|uniref:polysaccharide biosynthesis protein n=1 Tax=Flavobacterium johnsoniae TaxID=986 RepID=UPI0025AF0482|nr:polysaccharide biosynthesis protein [Flavobacterium johnsoniae]WJS94222.1 polysaccharide biosynthesis protein [Flavobacterium johnsoniae]
MNVIKSTFLKDTLIKLKQHPKYETIISWGKLISITGSAQILIQALGFASGILVIRLLPVEEYALYTLANTMLGTMTILADGGISTGIMSQGAKVWQDKEKLGAVLATGLYLRRKFAVGSLLVATPVLMYLLLHNNASWLTTLLIVGALIPAFFAALSDSLLEIVPKLHQDIVSLQKNQVSVGIVRFLFLGLTMFIFPWAFIALLANGIPRVIGNVKLRKIADKFADKTQKSDPAVEKEVMQIVKKILPGAIYFCISGQITIWLISVFGNTTAVAQLGALGRLAVLLNIVSVLINTLIVPRFARLAPKRNDLLKKVLYTICLILLLSGILLLLVAIFPEQILMVLGKSYKGLSYEMILSVLIGCVNLGISIFISFSSSRGWVINPILTMVFNIFGTVFPLFFVDVSTINGVLMLSLFSSLWGLVIYGTFTFLKIFKLDN